MVIGRVGCAQIELVTASEPLFFSHANISDEYALALPTGDALLDGFPFRTFLADPDDGELVGRIKHGAGQMVLHPFGLLHWPGMLRPPYEPPPFPGPRRCGLSLVFCAQTPTEPGERPLVVDDALSSHTKAYRGAPPFHLVDVMKASSSSWLGQVGDARMDLLVGAERVTGRGYLAVLRAEADSRWFACDLAYVDDEVTLEGVERALWFTAEHVEPPPESWTAVPPLPMPVFEEGPREALPVTIDGLTVEALDDARVRVHIGSAASDVPRYWLARMLYRIALHDYALGYLETYERFFYDDRGGFRLGLRGGGHIELDAAGIATAVETLYRAVAPDGYVEHLA